MGYKANDLIFWSVGSLNDDFRVLGVFLAVVGFTRNDLIKEWARETNHTIKKNSNDPEIEYVDIFENDPNADDRALLDYALKNGFVVKIDLKEFHICDWSEIYLRGEK